MSSSTEQMIDEQTAGLNDAQAVALSGADLQQKANAAVAGINLNTTSVDGARMEQLLAGQV